MEELDLKELFFMFWNKKLEIILITLMFVAVGIGYSYFFVKPEYTSTTSLVLAQSSSSGQTGDGAISATDLTMNSKLVSTYSELIKRKAILGQVCENLNIPDGFGTVLASKLKHGQIKERIAGIEMFDELCKLSLKTKSKIFIYGAKEENLDLAIKNIEKKYKNINICGYINGYIHEEDALKTILKATPDFLFVALGSPKQENFIIKNKQKFKDIKDIYIH